MKFGKLDDIRGIDFQLPPLAATNPLGLSGHPAARVQGYVGLPRWSSKEWLGELYPKGTKAGDYLAYYARSFNSIELNSTHYRSPSPEQVRTWYAASQPGFRFCPKLPQVISHHRKLIDCRAELLRFTQAIVQFDDRLGHSFVQLHDSFGPALLGNLRQFLDQWPAELPLAMEFRHPDWFEAHQLLPEAADLLAARGVAPVITDVAGRRDVLHHTLTAPAVMLRLVGNGLHETDYQRADAWQARLQAWQRLGLDTVYLFAHQPGDLQAKTYGHYLIEGLDALLPEPLPRPGLPREGGSQMRLFE